MRHSNRVKGSVILLPRCATSEQPVPALPLQASGGTAAPLVARVRDYLELTKPRILVLSLVTVAVGYFLGSDAAVFNFSGLAHTLIGAGLVAAGAAALNQVFERHSDARMGRTEFRPLPDGRLSVRHGLCFGVIASLVGVAYLAALAHVLAAVVALAIQTSYLFAYTPLKRRTTLNTAVGAVSGALPPLLGWAAAAGAISKEAWGLFGIVFLWQFPHFLAIAWMYREEYARAGMKMLPVVDPTGRVTGYHVLAYCLALIPVSLSPSVLGMAGTRYFVGACVLGGWFLYFAVRFCWATHHARALLRASLVYLPVLFLMLLADRSEVRPWMAPGFSGGQPVVSVTAGSAEAELAQYFVKLRSEP